MNWDPDKLVILPFKVVVSSAGSELIVEDGGERMASWNVSALGESECNSRPIQHACPRSSQPEDSGKEDA